MKKSIKKARIVPLKSHASKKKGVAMRLAAKREVSPKSALVMRRTIEHLRPALQRLAVK